MALPPCAERDVGMPNVADAAPLLHPRIAPRPFRDEVKTASTNGYDSVQVEYHNVREEKLTFPELGHLGKAGTPVLRHLHEFRLVAVDTFDPSKALKFNNLFKM